MFSLANLSHTFARTNFQKYSSSNSFPLILEENQANHCLYNNSLAWPPRSQAYLSSLISFHTPPHILCARNINPPWIPSNIPGSSISQCLCAHYSPCNTLPHFENLENLALKMQNNCHLLHAIFPDCPLLKLSVSSLSILSSYYKPLTTRACYLLYVVKSPSLDQAHRQRWSSSVLSGDDLI